MRSLFLKVSLFAAAIALASCVTAPGDRADVSIQRAIERINAAPDAVSRLRADVAWLASDAREGRETGTDAYQEAADYVAARMADIGLEPGSDGGWFQQVPFIAATPVRNSASMSITGPDGSTKPLVDQEDFIVRPSLAEASFSIENAPAAFVGYGVHAPAFGHDDYAGVDISGKVVVYFSGAPDIFDNESRAHFTSNSLKAKEASERGAIGAIALTTAASEKSRSWSQMTANPSYTSMTWIWPDGRPETSGPNIQGTATLHPDMAASMFEGAPHSYARVRAAADGEGEATGSFDLAVSVSFSGAMEREEISSPNVVGLIPGADPALKHEYVVLSAHLDHVGLNEKLIRQGKDGINNGAMDNAIGVATLLEVARTFLREDAPPRSVLILAVTAEEKGLLGSDYFAHFPTVKDGEMVANVNLDMPLMLHSFTDVIAFGAERSSIGPIMNAALEQTGVSLSPDPIPELGIFTRSDHYRFVEQGVPSIFLWTGFANGGEAKFWDFYKNHYHSPSDDLSQPIRYDDLARFSDINYIIARALATTPEKPEWNEGDFFGDLFAGE